MTSWEKKNNDSSFNPWSMTRYGPNFPIDVVQNEDGQSTNSFS